MARSVRSQDPQAGENPALHVVEAPAPAQKAGPVKLLASDSTEDAAVCVFLAALDHFEANLDAFRHSQAPESVHQMRVALRRLRAAIGLFKKALSGPSIDAGRARAKEIASVLGRARNWDVFHDMLQGAPSDALAREASYHVLLDALEFNRSKAYRSARETLADAGTSAFLADFRKAVAERDWTAAPGMTDEGSARPFAREALTKLRKRVLKKSKGLAARAPEERHQLRIALKKARYGAEFFESLFSHVEDAEDFSLALAKMQDGLGVYNDMEMANALLDEIDAHGEASLRASGFVRGWFAHAALAGAAHAKKSEKRLKGLTPFWE
ncbi:CHAD domain-containing protein [Methylocystis parvus]|uniref:CHAD domain-containing protein n=1 Tax=Methylocystis parvus TaxID=134 RepID=A0A6B8LXJ2_9HYPH|nr:CHAD domain-containing protein [Methylocystis parvus]QGM97107.1 CHAD domain-containing protein [Methylocystis parvus]WBJ98990.1 CHAD domain-containing protein [Methylocystis parvus OBBP]